MQSDILNEPASGESFVPYTEQPFKLDLVGPEAEQPQQAVPAPQQSAFTQMIQSSAKGRISDHNDIELTMDGIANGDPLGLETIDFGFFDDGTPAIVINGAGVPVRHEQWMSMMAMRNKAREEMRARVEFEGQRSIAMNAIQQVYASGALPEPMATLFMAQAATDPKGATKNLSDAYLGMQKDGGRELMGKTAAEIQAQRNENLFGFMLRPQGKEHRSTTNRLGETTNFTVDIPSLRDQRVKELEGKDDRESQITRFALQSLEDFQLPPEYRRVNPTRQIGIFDRIATDPDQWADLSLFSRLRHIAAFGNMHPGGGIPIDPPPQIPSDLLAAGRVELAGLGVREQQRYLLYLKKLDRWAANVFGYDLSSDEALQAIASQAGVMNMTMPQRNQAEAPATPAAPQGTRPPTRVSPSATGKATP